MIGVIFLNATVSVDGSGSFRLRRIMVWLHPEEYADSWGYQTIQALYAIGSGGFLAEDLETVFRSWEVYLRHRMT